MLKRKISIIIIFISFLIYSTNKLNYYKTITTSEKNINEIFEEEQKPQEPEQKESIPNNYLGYLSIENLNIKNLITLGTTNKILDQNIVGLYDNGNNLDSDIGQIILAGHNNNYVFKELHKIKLNEEIKIKTRKQENTYVVTKKEIIQDIDTTHFKNNIKYKELILITCIKKDTRLLVIAHPK